MVTKSITMKFREAKKHSYIYEATEPDAALRTVYVMKTAFETPPPEVITVSIGYKA